MTKRKRKPFDPMALDDIDAFVRCINRQALHTDLGYPRACPNRRCRRHRKCVGDPDDCHAIFWPVVPEEIKVWLRALARSAEANHSPKKARRIAGEALRAQRIRAKNLEYLGESDSVASHK